MLPFDHKNCSAAARLIAVLAIAGVLSTSALTALAAVIDEAPDAPAVLLEEGEAPDVEEAPTEETATPGEEADSSEGEAVPAEETEAPEEAPDADSPDAPTEEDEPEAPADETSEETAEEAPEGEGAESVPEEGISAQPPVPTVSAEAVPVPPEELPEDLAPLFIQISPALIEAAAEEFQTLTPEQTEQITEIWTANNFLFSPPAEMLDVYAGIGDLSNEAAFLIYLANASACVAYVDAHYAGEASYLAAFEAAFAQSMTEYETLRTEDLSEDEVRVALEEIVARSYAGMTAAGDAEAKETDTHWIATLVFSYGETQGAVDAEAFFAAVTQ